MKQQSGTFPGARGASIFYQYWRPVGPVAGLMVLVHGSGEHSARYHDFARFLTEHGYAVAAVDHYGHGQSEGTPGYVEYFEDYLDTLRLFELRVSGDFPGVPKILLGHSLGGLISSLYLLDHQQDFIGCVLSGAAIKTDIEPGRFQKWLIGFLSNWFPKAGVLQLDAEGVSRDPRVVQDYKNDPLVHHGKLSARKVYELFSAMQTVRDGAPRITLPLLILHGGADTMTSPEGSRFLHEHVSSTDNTLKIYPELFHEILNEPERDKVWQDVLAWCDRLLQRNRD